MLICIYVNIMEVVMAKINLGNFIIKKRKKINLSSRQLALACDVTPPYMSDIEKNKRIPSFDLLTKS